MGLTPFQRGPVTIAIIDLDINHHHRMKRNLERIIIKKENPPTIP
jgi:hypothetical protein